MKLNVNLKSLRNLDLALKVLVKEKNSICPLGLEKSLLSRILMEEI